MPSSARFTNSFRRWLVSFAACLAVIAQFAVAVSPLVEARNTSTASHVEPDGQQAHYAHNDADCAVCQARLHQGFTARVPDLQLADAAYAPAIVQTVERVLAPDLFSPASPRAPPAG